MHLKRLKHFGLCHSSLCAMTLHMDKRFQKVSFSRAIGGSFTDGNFRQKVEPWAFILAEEVVGNAVKIVDYSVPAKLRSPVLALLKEMLLKEVHRQLPQTEPTA